MAFKIIPPKIDTKTIIAELVQSQEFIAQKWIIFQQVNPQITPPPAEQGTLYYDVDTNSLLFFDGSVWRSFGEAGPFQWFLFEPVAINDGKTYVTNTTAPFYIREILSINNGGLMVITGEIKVGTLGEIAGF